MLVPDKPVKWWINNCEYMKVILEVILLMLFRPYFHYCSSSVHYCEDRFRIHTLSIVQIYDFHIFTFVYWLCYIVGCLLQKGNCQLCVFVFQDCISYADKVLGGNPAMDWDLIQEGVVLLLVASCHRNQDKLRSLVGHWAREETLPRETWNFLEKSIKM